MRRKKFPAVFQKICKSCKCVKFDWVGVLAEGGAVRGGGSAGEALRISWCASSVPTQLDIRILASTDRLSD
jgi:hypothetical protein